MLEKQYSDIKVAGAYNVGPDEIDCISTGELVTLFCKEWNESETTGHTVKWKSGVEKNAPHEAFFFETRLFEIKECIWVETPMAYRKSYSGDDILYTGSIV